MPPWGKVPGFGYVRLAGGRLRTARLRHSMAQHVNAEGLLDDKPVKWMELESKFSMKLSSCWPIRSVTICLNMTGPESQHSRSTSPRQAPAFQSERCSPPRQRMLSAKPRWALRGAT